MWRRVVAKAPVFRLLSGLYPHSYQAATQLSIAVRRIFEKRRADGVPTVLVHSGDLTSQGKEAEFSVGATFLDHGHSVSGMLAGLDLRGANRHVRVMDIPGNHDLWSRLDNRKQRAASSHYGGAYPRRVDVSLRDGRQLAIHGLDSNRSAVLSESLANGKVAGSELTEVCRRLRDGTDGQRIQGVVLHHPLEVKSGTEPRLLWWEIQKLDARQTIARTLREAGAQFVLCGHIHMQQFLPRDSARPLQFTAGSGCQIGGPNQFWVLDIHPEGVVPHAYSIPLDGFAYESAALGLQSF